MIQTNRGSPPPRRQTPIGWRREVRDRIAELEHLRSQLQETRISARNVGGAEGERLEAKVGAMIEKIGKQIDDLRASLE
jgi:transposase